MIIVIERRYLRNDGDHEWRDYVRHKWTRERAEKSVRRLNRTAPKTWAYRWSIEQNWGKWPFAPQKENGNG